MVTSKNNCCVQRICIPAFSLQEEGWAVQKQCCFLCENDTRGYILHFAYVYLGGHVKVVKTYCLGRIPYRNIWEELSAYVATSRQLSRRQCKSCHTTRLDWGRRISYFCVKGRTTPSTHHPKFSRDENFHAPVGTHSVFQGLIGEESTRNV